MPIERVINGVIYEFPDGTSEAVIRRFEAQKTTGAAAPAPATQAAPKPRAQPGVTGLPASVLQGLSFGFSDEAIAGLRSAMGKGNYEDLVKAEREALRKYAEEHPIRSTVGEVGGALIPAALTMGASLFPQTAARVMGPTAAKALVGTAPSVGRMAGYGAAQGATTAVGTSEKPMAELPAEALKGAVAGAAVAGGMGVLGKYVVAPGFSRLKAALGFGDGNKMADIAIAQALQKDGLTPEQAAAKMAALSRGEITLADMGENTTALLRRASSTPGPGRIEAKAALAQREAGRVPRVSDDLRSLMSGSKDFYTDVQDLIKKRSEDAKALYDAAYSAAPVFGPDTAPEIAKLRNLPSFQKAMQQGAKRMADLDLDIADPKNTLRALHETKLALDDMINEAMRGGNTNQAKTLIDMKQRMLLDMEKASPEYRIARQSYAGDSEMLTAMEEGRKVYTMPEPEMRKLIKRFENSPSEYDAFRAGISQSMLEKLRMAGPTADPSTTILGRDAEQKLRRAFRDDAAFDEFKNRLLQERQMLTTEKTGFRRTPVDTDLQDASGGVGAATALAQGRPVTAALEAARMNFPRAVGMPPQVSEPVVRKLTTPSPSVDPVINSIMQSLKAQEQQLLQATGVANAGAGMVGGLSAAREPMLQYPEDSMTPGPGPSGSTAGSPLSSLRP